MVMDTNSWAHEQWRRAAPDWTQRSQDRNYRGIVVRPSLNRLIGESRPIKDGYFVDIGCGDGSETNYIAEFLSRYESTGKFYGLDPQSLMIESATPLDGSVSTRFFVGDVQDFVYGKVEGVPMMQNRADIVTSLFVLQDTPDVEDIVKSAAVCLNNRGKAVFVLVHPEFGEAMRLKGALDIKEGKSDPRFVYNAGYPIVEEDGRTFFVPYFHRDLDFYRNLFSKYFRSSRFENLRPDRTDIDAAERDHISPFYKHDGNLYYPEIIEMPSSLLVVAAH